MRLFVALHFYVSYISILALVSRRIEDSVSVSEASCAAILETLDAEAIIQSVYRFALVYSHCDVTDISSKLCFM